MFEPRIVTITKVEWNGEDRVLFTFDDGFSWQGAKRKDFWNPEDKWEDVIKVGSVLRLWTIQYSMIVGFEIQEVIGLLSCWKPVWCVMNDFQPAAEREASGNAYVKFIEDEGIKIAGLIDEGKTYEEINKLISDEHTGNTHAYALNIGIEKATNKENADKIRRAHNEFWGVKDDKPGLVNPAVLSLETKE